jgi:hypothetical protein
MCTYMTCRGNKGKGIGDFWEVERGLTGMIGRSEVRGQIAEVKTPLGCGSAVGFLAGRSHKEIGDFLCSFLPRGFSRLRHERSEGEAYGEIRPPPTPSTPLRAGSSQSARRMSTRFCSSVRGRRRELPPHNENPVVWATGRPNRVTISIKRSWYTIDRCFRKQKGEILSEINFASLCSCGLNTACDRGRKKLRRS